MYDVNRCIRSFESKPNNGPEAFNYSLGDCVLVTGSSDYPLVHIRYHYRDETNTLHPTKFGIGLRLDEWKAFVNLMENEMCTSALTDKLVMNHPPILSHTDVSTAAELAAETLDSTPPMEVIIVEDEEEEEEEESKKRVEDLEEGEIPPSLKRKRGLQMGYYKPFDLSKKSKQCGVEEEESGEKFSTPVKPIPVLQPTAPRRIRTQICKSTSSITPPYDQSTKYSQEHLERVKLCHDLGHTNSNFFSYCNMCELMYRDNELGSLPPL